MTARRCVAASLALVILAASPALAGGQHIVAPGELSAAVAARVAKQDADRKAVAEALARPEVRDVAAKAGIEMSQVTAIAATLAGEDLVRAADAARQVNDRLAGGASTIVLSTTTIIIILLVVILLIVAIK